MSVPLRFSPPCARSPGKVADATVYTTMEADAELSLGRESSCEACIGQCIVVLILVRIGRNWENYNTRCKNANEV